MRTNARFSARVGGDDHDRPRFAVRLFGDFRIRDRWTEADLTPISRKTCAALAYLALSDDRRAGRELLAGLLWGDRREEQARASLRQSLATLRAGPLGQSSLLFVSRQTVGLNSAEFTTDAHQTVELAEAGALQELTEALARLRGELLSGFEGLSDAYDDWLLGERARQHSRLVEKVLQAAARPGPLATRRSILTSLQQLDTGNEAIGRLGMRLDAEAGDLAGLHRRFQRLEAQLARDFDSKPSPETIALYRSLTAQSAAVLLPEPRPHPSQSARSEPPLVVVTPFASLGDSASARLLADICVEDVETALGRFRDLRILTVADPDLPKLQVASVASVAGYLLQGAVREQGDTLRVDLRLSRIADSLLVWSQQLQIDPADLSTATDAIVARIAGAIAPVVDRDLTRAPPPAESGSPAFETYLRARGLLLHADTLEIAQEAGQLLEQTIDQASGFTNAYLYLARLYSTDFLHMLAGHDPAPLRARAFELSKTAAILDPENAHVHSLLGWCYLRRGDWKPARERFETAVDFNPHFADRVEEAGFGHCHLGDLDAAERLIRQAFALNPFPTSDYFADNGVLLFLRGDHGRAEEQFERAGDPALYYAAVRLANLALLEPASPALPALRARLTDRFARIWRSPALPTGADMLRWLDSALPLRLPEHRATLLNGLAAAGIR